MKKISAPKKRVQEGAVISHPVKMRAPRGPAGCNCFHCFGKPPGKRGEKPCEYYDHHCDTCHERLICSTVACAKEFNLEGPSEETP